MISVCMATYNGEKFVKQQIESILIQLSSSDELIISDDGSTDNTITIINDINDKRIKLYNGGYQNVIKNFENALNRAKGDIIFLADQDDIWCEDKVKTIISHIYKYDCIVSDSYITDEKLNILYESFFKYFKSKKGIIKNIIKSSYYGSCMAFTREILDYALPFPETKEIGHDLWLGLVAETKGKVLFLDKPLVYYRRHSGAFCETGLGKTKRNLLQIINGRLIILKNYIHFYLKNKIWN